MALTGLLSEITKDRVSGVLLERQPLVLEDEPDQVLPFEALVKGAAVQVTLLTGVDPAPGPIRDMAIEAIVLETGSKIEYASHPEQQRPGDTGRGYHLHQRYLELLAELRQLIRTLGGIPADGGAAGIVTGPARPRGRFPERAGYPDPIQVRGTRRREC